MAESKEMWTYWRDKYGHVGAAEQYYPKALAANLELQLAVIQIKSAKAMIDRFFEEDDVD